ncbi:MAG: N-acetylmuramoyl-L-alanine amidase [Flavobacteriales bacterium]|nr:N-acetylmuramoyl-L-alanine amidase [Flavobacteriales bacterium]MBT6699285.1 N-acetylmuramoyl-L-alanine amidase [Flavobacteriales bacterium]MBT6815125.1 N-acetylmuramoyl-L-alanine amidase [Flavobacteriales bacterium]MBT7726270.1 N-acetylmuramoyl-L-alanine amidase [Flavobacteriales bacterium]
MNETSRSIFLFNLSVIFVCKTNSNSRLTKLSKIYHTFNLFGKRIFLFFLLLFGINNFSFSQSSENKIKTIVLDAGHGGKDPGNLGTGRYKENEKEIALKVTLMIGEYISEAFPDLKVLYTRIDDSYPTLRGRTDFANDNNADLFISIHCDAFDKSSAHGTSSHVMGLDYSEKNLRVAQKENSVIYLEDNYKENYDGFEPNTPESYIIFSLTQNVYLDQSIQIANNVQKQFTERVKRKNRGVKQAPFWVTSRVNMPSVLIELGFLTNPDEEDFLHSENGQIYMASAIFRAFKEYKETVDGLLVIDKDDNNEDLKEIEILENKDLKEELNIVFKIQLGTYLKSMKNSSVFDGMNVEEDLANGTYRYLLSVGNDKKEADKLKLKHRSGKFAGAFIVAFHNEKQISVKEALDLLNK